MIRFAWLVVALLTAGCTQDGADTAPPAAAPAVPAAAELEVSGAEAYEMVCASCHDTGQNGAPLTGDADAWSERSVLWEAVLFNHAEKGYLGMPQKGGRPQLSDRSVAAAVEYMLSITFPDIPPD